MCVLLSVGEGEEEEEDEEEAQEAAVAEAQKAAQQQDIEDKTQARELLCFLCRTAP